jgi:hypothetical protein
MGTICGFAVSVLVDTGSTHNILQPRIANFLQLPVAAISQFSVMVGNGEHISCFGICEDRQLLLQSHRFKVPCYLLPI